MTITEFRKKIKQLLATFHISKESNFIITEGNQHYRVKSIGGYSHKGLPYINIEIEKCGHE